MRFVKSVHLKIRNLLERIRSYFFLKKLLRQKYIHINIGSGPIKGLNGWTTLDLAGSDIIWDLNKGLPFPDNRIDTIYAAHTFEHFNYNKLIYLFNECYRVLKKNGNLLISVPDSSLYIRAYFENNIFKSKDMSYLPAYVDTCSFLDQVNYIAYMGGEHQYLFDKENLINTLKKAPFAQIELREFDDKIDDDSRAYESIYAIAIK